MLDIKVGDFWSHSSGDYYRRVMDLVDTGIDQIVYWKDEGRVTGRCVVVEFEKWVSKYAARLTKRQSEKSFRLEHNERYKKCGNYALAKPGLPEQANNGLFSESTERTTQNTTSTAPQESPTLPTDASRVAESATTTSSTDGLNAAGQRRSEWTEIVQNSLRNYIDEVNNIDS